MSTPVNSTYNTRSVQRAQLTAAELDLDTDSDSEDHPAPSLSSTPGLSSVSDTEETSSGLNSVSDSEETSLEMAKIEISPFCGRPGEKAADWFERYLRFGRALKIASEVLLMQFPFHMRDHAHAWFWSQAKDIASLEELKEAFCERFNGSDGLPVTMALFSLQQREAESVADYFTRVTELTTGQQLTQDMLTSLAMKGLRRQLRDIVMPQNLHTLEQVRKAAILAERTIETSLLEARAAALDVDTFSAKVTEQVVAVLSSRFQQMREPVQQQESPQPTAQHQSWSQRKQNAQRPNRPQGGNTQLGPQHERRNTIACHRCGGRNCMYYTCPAVGVTCLLCGGKNHFSELCGSKFRKGFQKNH